MKTRFIPEKLNATLLDSQGTDAAIYIFLSPNNGKPAVMAFHGKKSTPDNHYWFPTEEQRQTFIEQFIDSRRKHDERIKQAREDRKKPHDLEIGAILYDSWGYDQTNVDFYKVVSRTNRTVEVVQIGTKILDDENGNNFTADSVVADPDRVISDPTKHVVNTETRSIRINSFSHAFPWGGKPLHQTAWGFGH